MMLEVVIRPEIGDDEDIDPSGTAALRIKPGQWTRVRVLYIDLGGLMRFHHGLCSLDKFYPGFDVIVRRR